MNQTNTNTPHTSGNWEVSPDGNDVEARYGPNPEDVMGVCALYAASPEQDAANARLIASAPDMLKAGKNVVPYMQMIKQNYPEMVGLIAGLEDMQTAIRKATGNQ